VFLFKEHSNHLSKIDNTGPEVTIGKENNKVQSALVVENQQTLLVGGRTL